MSVKSGRTNGRRRYNRIFSSSVSLSLYLAQAAAAEEFAPYLFHPPSLSFGPTGDFLSLL